MLSVAEVVAFVVCIGFLLYALVIIRRPRADTTEEILEKRAQFALLVLGRFERIGDATGRSLDDVIHDAVALSQRNLSRIDEIAEEQLNIPGLLEVWVFAEHPVDLETKFYTTVKTNIAENFVSYTYFQPSEQFFFSLRQRLLADVKDGVHVNAHLHLILVPEIAFASGAGFALWIPRDINQIRGKVVAHTAPDGTIKQAQEMDPLQVRRHYARLVPILEAHYGRHYDRVHGMAEIREISQQELFHYRKVQ